MTAEKSKTICPSCGGTGEIGFFQGESRFLLTREECPVCYGLGYILPEEEGGSNVFAEKRGDDTT